MTNSEKLITLLSKSYFFNEFTYSDLLFTKTSVGDFEFSDVAIKFNNNLILIQIKEFTTSKLTPEEWFKYNIKIANKQHKDSLRFIQENPNVTFDNGHGNVLKLNQLENSNITFISIFDNELIHNYERIKTSQELGSYNIFSKEDFTLLCKKLITPKEILNYLKFRINFLLTCKSGILIKEVDSEIQMISIMDDEESMINAYLHESYNQSNIISINCESFRSILSDFKSKVFDSNKTQYVAIIERLMEMNRRQVYELVERLKFELDNSFNEPLNSLRYIILNDFGILLMSSCEFEKDRSSIILKDFKYCKKLENAMLIEVVKKEKNTEIMWLYLNYPFVYDEEEEKYAIEFEKFLNPCKILQT